MSDKSMDAAEFSSKTNAYLTEYIKFADAKAGALLMFATITGAVVSATSERVLTAARSAARWELVVGGAIGVAVVVSVTLTLWHTAIALSPRTRAANHSLNSFPDIADMASQDFVNAVGALTPEAIAKNYSLHNHTLATITLTKFRSIERAMKWMRVMLLSTFALALLHVLLGANPALSPRG